MTAEREQHASSPAHATGVVQFIPVEDIAPDEAFRLRPDGDVSQLATALGRLGQLSPVEVRLWPGAGSDGPRWQVVAGFRRLAAVRMLARDRVLARLHQDLCEDDAWGLALSEALLHQPLTGDELEALRSRLRESRVARWAEDLVDEALVRAPVAAELRERFYDFLAAAGQEGSLSAPPGDADAASEVAAFVPVAASTDPPNASPPPTASPIEPPSEPPPQSTEAPSRPAPATASDGAGDVVSPGTSLSPAAPVDPGEAAQEEYVEVTPDELVQDLIGRLSTLNQDLATAVEAWKDLPVDGRRTIVDQARYVAALLPFMETPE